MNEEAPVYGLDPILGSMYPVFKLIILHRVSQAIVLYVSVIMDF